MSRRQRKLGLLAAPAIICLGLTSCQSSATPPNPTDTVTETAAASPTDFTSGSQSPSASASAPKPATAEGPAENIPVPKMPPAAKTHDDAGALAFLHHYFDLMNYALETYDADPLVKVTSRSCLPCGEGLIDPIWHHADEGHWQVGGTNHLSVTGVTMSSKTEAIVSFGLRVDGQTIYSAPNTVLEEMPPAEGEIQGVAVLRTGKDAKSPWMMYDINMSLIGK